MQKHKLLDRFLDLQAMFFKFLFRFTLPYILFHKTCISCTYILKKKKQTSTPETTLDVSL